MRVAVIGAGIAGLSLAHALKSKGPQFSVTLFEKARGVSGRLATRYQDDFAFDHGAAHFTLRDKRFIDFIQPYQQQGIISSWQPLIAQYSQSEKISQQLCRELLHVSSPKMNQLCKKLAETVELKLQTRVADFKKNHQIWSLFDEHNNALGEFDWVISSAPSVQTAELFGDLPSFSAKLNEVKMTGCFSLMLGFSELNLPQWQLAHVDDSPIAKISIEHSKPNRKQGISVLIQSDNAWADACIEHDPEELTQILKQHLQAIMPFDKSHISYQRLHRWRYANVAQSAAQPYLIDRDNKLAACGDWCLEGRVEAAFISAMELAECFNEQ